MNLITTHNNMKIKYILPLLMLFSVAVFAQGNKGKREQIKALKVSYITAQLDLGSEQAAKFWPVYNEYEEKEFQIRHARMRPIIKKINELDIDKMNEKEALNYLNQLQDADEDLFNLRKKMQADLKPIIGPVKLLKLKKAEEGFNRELLSKYKNKKK